MDHIGIDLHKRESPICILAEGGELIDDLTAELGTIVTILSLSTTEEFP